MEQQQKKCEGPVWCVCEERRASEECRARSGAWDCTSSLRYVGVAVVRTCEPVYKWSAASPEASVASEAAAWYWCDPGSGRRLWPGCSGRAVVYRKSPPVRHSTAHCSSPVWKRRCCTRLSGWRRQSVDCKRGAEFERGSCRPFSGLVHKKPILVDLILFSLFLKQFRLSMHQQCPGPNCFICLWLDLRIIYFLISVLNLTLQIFVLWPRKHLSLPSFSLRGRQLLNCLALKLLIGPSALPLINQLVIEIS